MLTKKKRNIILHSLVSVTTTKGPHQKSITFKYFQVFLSLNDTKIIANNNSGNFFLQTMSIHSNTSLVTMTDV